MKKFLNFGQKSDKEKIDNLVNVYLEIKEVAEKLCEKIENKILELKEIEKRVDTKIEQYKNLISRIDAQKVTKSTYDKKNEVIKLYLSGEEPENISRILGIPIGEVELLINLYKIKTSKK